MALSCKQIQTEFSALLDDELDTEDRELVEEHLAECADCLRELHGFQQVTDAYRYHHPVKAPNDFEERLRDALAPQITPLRPSWITWRVAAAAMILLGSGLSVWRMAARNTNEIQLSKNMPEMAEESIVGTPAPASPELVAAEADQGRSLRQDTASDAVDSYASRPMVEEESMRSAAETLPREARESPPVAKKEAPLALALPKRMRRESGVDKSVVASQSPAPPLPAPPVEERIVVAEKSAPADTASSPAPESIVMKDDSAVGALAAGLLEAKSEAPRKAVAAAEEGPALPLQWRNRSFVLRDDTLRQADYDGETLKDIPVPSDGWTTLLDRFPISPNWSMEERMSS